MDAADPLGALADRLESEWYGTQPAPYLATIEERLAKLLALMRFALDDEDT